MTMGCTPGVLQLGGVVYPWGPHLLILDDRIWSDFSCTTRPGIIFLIGLGWLAVVVLMALLKDKLLARHFPAQQGVVPQPIWVGSRIAYWSVGCVIALVLMAIGTIVALASNKTHLATDGRVLVEKGCFRLQAYEKRIEFESARVEYKFRDAGKKPRNALVFTDDERQIVVNLNTVLRHDVMVRIAPDAMREFATRQEKLGRWLHPSVRALLND